MIDITIKLGDNLELLKSYPDNHFDSVVTDAPYGLGKEPDALKLLQDWIDHGYYEIKGKGFMGKSWDAFVPQPIFWKEVFRVLKPGGYLLCFFGTRTYDWGTMAIRLAGFEIRDMITWRYGSGFPKSLNISKALDKMDIENANVEGWGTALKPATEPICVARKPLSGTVAQNMIVHGTGGINIDGCMIEWDDKSLQNDSKRRLSPRTDITGNHFHASTGGNNAGKYIGESKSPTGRFPANLIMDPFMARIMDEQTGILTSGKPIGVRKAANNIYGQYSPGQGVTGFGDSGGASRFFYCAKASQDERNAGCEHIPTTTTTDGRDVICDNAFQRGETERNNNHPTVKPISVMRWLQRLVTPVNGLTLDPFAGSGTSGCSAAFEGFNIVLMEAEAEYMPIIEARTKHWQKVANREKYIQELKNSQQSLFNVAI